MAPLTSLPPLAPFPESQWRAHLVPQELEACLEAWIALLEAHLSLPDSDFSQVSTKDETLPIFLQTYTSELAKLSPDIPSFDSPEKAQKLRKDAYQLLSRLSKAKPCPKFLSEAEFVLNLCKAYGKRAAEVLSQLWTESSLQLETSLGQYKSSLTSQLESGIKGDPQKTEAKLKRLNHLLDASPETAAFFLSGSDFLDALISCYKLMNPPLRKAIVATAYLCLFGLTKGEKPNYSQVVDTLYALKDAAEKHKAGPLNERESLVPELISITPLLAQLKDRINAQSSLATRAKPIISELESYRKPTSGRPKRLIKRKIDKGKGKAPESAADEPAPIHVHRLSLVSQVQDLFPDLGDGFIVKLLDEYNDNVEDVISHLLEDSLPPHLTSLDRSAKLPPTPATFTPYIRDLSPDQTPDVSRSASPIPTRRNIHDDDELDNLAVEAGKLHFGRKDRGTADEALRDRAHAPDKARILAALAAFDSDDDERDDTYDTADVGGTVEVSGPDGLNVDATRATAISAEQDAQDEVLFKSYKVNPGLFARDTATRRSKQREQLKSDSGLTDEAIEGWAIMLSRDSRRLRRLEAKFSGFSGQQVQLQSTRWQDSPEGSGSDWENPNNRGRGGRLRGQGRGRGRGGRGGSASGPSGDKGTDVARDRKEANKGKVGNHNRRDQRAKKIARAGFAG